MVNFGLSAARENKKRNGKVQLNYNKKYKKNNQTPMITTNSIRVARAIDQFSFCSCNLYSDLLFIFFISFEIVFSDWGELEVIVFIFYLLINSDSCASIVVLVPILVAFFYHSSPLKNHTEFQLVIALNLSIFFKDSWVAQGICANGLFFASVKPLWLLSLLSTSSILLDRINPSGRYSALVP